ncbi:hypothetical protein [Hyalangium versicolor]|uniref:hypothetical protein n=1 Tax=Hyalangium versicolor TaxID=2861190 RepID=UPI001CCE58B9|nr:hypothetical protein [Hyalangium versicolor]
MTTAISEPTTKGVSLIDANTFNVQNRRISVSFSATSITGDPLFHYKDREREVNARGDDIRQVETEIGTLVTITLRPDADAGALLFTLLVPRVVLASPVYEQAITTQGFFTRSQLIPHILASAQLQTTDVVELKGTASFVVS